MTAVVERNLTNPLADYLDKVLVIRDKRVTDQQARDIFLKECLPGLKEFFAENLQLLSYMKPATLEQYNKEIEEWVNQRGYNQRVDSWIDTNQVPPSLPYTPIPVGLGYIIPWICQPNVKYFNTRLQIPAQNYPQNPGTITPLDYADASNQPAGSVFQYKHISLPPATLRRIVISAFLDNERFIPSTGDLHQCEAFFSDPPAVGGEIDWYIQFSGASKIVYTTPPNPDTYPANEILRFNSVERLTAMATRFYKDNASVQNSLGAVTPIMPWDECLYHWEFDIDGGIVFQTYDVLKMVTGLPTIDGGGDNYLKKLYVTAHFSMDDAWRFSPLQATKKLLATVTIPFQGEEQ